MKRKYSRSGGIMNKIIINKLSAVINVTLYSESQNYGINSF